MNRNINPANYGALGILMESRRITEMQEWPDSGGEDDHGRDQPQAGDTVRVGGETHNVIANNGGNLRTNKPGSSEIHNVHSTKAEIVNKNPGLRVGDRVATPHDNNVHTVLGINGSQVTHSPENGSGVHTTHITKVTQLPRY